MKREQIGKFTIPFGMVDKHPEKVAAIFAMLKLVPVRAENMFHSREIEYIAISERFPEISRNEVVPLYILTITSDNKGWPQTVQVDRVKA